ncbi:MAG TPA: hypothetical protein VGX25_34080 [Actinophytocola sp.]|uniref:hypothetical protein n=1 Tax=Actinophytocola sp. TaxID=1872138 RepID=UPI002DDD084C|nr:hypothetical protein [Actinophytocola sp.]HEV2784444.1 hypothetical protein [Actinophytocola sp.]
MLEAGGFVERLPDGRFRPALTGLANLHPVIPLWNRLADAVRTGVPVPGGYPPSMALPAGGPPRRRRPCCPRRSGSWRPVRRREASLTPHGIRVAG